jgi:hypothetical protein
MNEFYVQRKYKDKNDANILSNLFFETLDVKYIPILYISLL